MTRPPTALVAGLLTLALTGVSSGQSPTGPPARDTLALATAKRLLLAMHAQEVLLEGLDSTFATMRKGRVEPLEQHLLCVHRQQEPFRRGESECVSGGRTRGRLPGRHPS